MYKAGSALPLDAVKGLEAVDVAEWLQLAKARERGKYACLWCDSSDAMEAYRGQGRGFYCFSCGKAGSTIDAVIARRGLDLAGAVRALADNFGILTPDAPLTGYGRARIARAPRSTPRPTPTPAAPDPAEVARQVERAEVYGAALEVLTLTTRGLAYLTARGLDYHAAGDGFRSVDGRQGWDQLARDLAGRFPPEQLREAFTPARDDGERHKLPWGGQAPALVIPYLYRGKVIALRFRNLEPRDKGDRYRDLGGRRPALPFNADVLDGCAGDEVHICEGELNAWTLAGEGLRAIGVPGAQTPWRPEWTPRVRQAARLVAWYDADAAGDRGAGKLWAALQTSLGSAWLEAHAREYRPPADPNDLHLRGELYGHVQRAAWRD